MGSQVDIFTRASHSPANAIEHEVAHLEPFGRGLAAAQKNADAGKQLNEGERLDKVVVRAAFQAFDAIVDGITSGKDQNRRAHFAVADLLQDCQSVHIRKAQVENYQVVISGMNHVDGRTAGVGHVDGVAPTFQATREEIGNALFIFYDEDPHNLSVYRAPRNFTSPALGGAGYGNLRRRAFERSGTSQTAASAHERLWRHSASAC